jgi:hypothetical protein
MIRDQQQFEATQVRVSRFVRQAAQIRRTEKNPENFRMSVAGFIRQIDRMNFEIREYLSSFEGDVDGNSTSACRS